MFEKELKEQTKEKMEEYNIKKVNAEGLTITYKDEYSRKGIDTTRLKEELPDIYEDYLKETKVSSSVSITVE